MKFTSTLAEGGHRRGSFRETTEDMGSIKKKKRKRHGCQTVTWGTQCEGVITPCSDLHYVKMQCFTRLHLLAINQRTAAGEVATRNILPILVLLKSVRHAAPISPAAATLMIPRTQRISQIPGRCGFLCFLLGPYCYVCDWCSDQESGNSKRNFHLMFGGHVFLDV